MYDLIAASRLFTVLLARFWSSSSQFLYSSTKSKVHWLKVKVRIEIPFTSETYEYSVASEPLNPLQRAIHSER